MTVLSNQEKLEMKILPVLILITACQTAHAGLGDTVDSVPMDQARMMAQRRFQPEGSYATHVMTLSTGTVVREYVAGGRVFAVTWEGPVVPNLSRLLGAYGDKAHREIRNIRQHQRGMNAPLSLSSEDFVLQSGGRMRSYFGKAYIPSAMPAGVNPEDLR